ncbi:radical SAM protein [Actinomadura fulvescens]|uniref:Radical SAM core domain-containing protein n=1 Tax=Actinomadura fulvescens TaxID=46160 RepID=A0ABN3PFQ3_9ACTN
MVNDVRPGAFPDFMATDLVIPSVRACELPNVAELEARGVLPPYFAAPLFVVWEVTGRCPLDCPFCYNDSPRRTHELTTVELLQVADQLAAMRVFGVYLTGGEPFIRRDLEKVIERLAARGVLVGVVTSGWSMSPALAGFLAERVASVSVSIDAGSAGPHDAIRRRAGSFDRALRTIGLLRGAGLKDTYVAATIGATNVGEIDALVELCLRLGVRALRLTPVILTDKGTLGSWRPAERADYERVGRELGAYASALAPELAIQWVDPSGHIRSGRLLGRVQVLRITAEGHLAISPYLPYVLGNLRETGIQECWDQGLRVAWRHPRIRAAIADIDSIHDLNEVGCADPTFTRLDPREADAACSPTML